MTMLNPPFRLVAVSAIATAEQVSFGHGARRCCSVDELPEELAPNSRVRLADLSAPFHCSVVGTCLGTVELRKLMTRFLVVRDASDLEVHHEAVRLAGEGGVVAKALHKALDQRHEPVVRRFSKAHDVDTLTGMWESALRQGEIPGAYWAVLTHRDATSELRNRVFGDVHMLSHLVGAANRADIRRLVALEEENAALRERSEEQLLRAQELAEERDRTIAQMQRELAGLNAERAKAGRIEDARSAADAMAAATSLVRLQAERRERAEQAAIFAESEVVRLRGELEHLGQHAQALGRELLAAETQLRDFGEGSPANRPLQPRLRGQRVFYVGGRPSSTPAIRDLVLRHAGEFQHHDGGLEDRKGLLASGVAWAHLVVFPVDCVDHDSAGNLKRMCQRQGVLYVPLRSASVASFAAALMSSPSLDEPDQGESIRPTGCLKNR
jgi:Uncharacterized protein conserved in bacteria (DUF2325)